MVRERSNYDSGYENPPEEDEILDEEEIDPEDWDDDTNWGDEEL